MTKDPPTFADILRADRERMQASQEDLAKLLGVSQQAVANWENGVSLPRRSRREKLLEVLGRKSGVARVPDPDNFLTRYGLSIASDDTRPSVGVLARARDILEREEQDRMDLRRALPTHLHAYLDTGVSVGATERKLNYLSDSLGVEIKRAPGNWVRTAHSFAPYLLQLVTARQISQSTHPDRKYLLIVIQDGNTPGAALQSIMFDGGVLGIWVTPVGSVAEAARLIENIENSKFPPPELMDAVANAVIDPPPE